jgi:hypothetical protein
LVFAQAASFPPATTDDVKIARYKSAGRLGLWPFLGAILDSLAVVVWFLYPSSLFYIISIGVFILLLAATAVYGAVVISRYL